MSTKMFCIDRDAEGVLHINLADVSALSRRREGSYAILAITMRNGAVFDIRDLPSSVKAVEAELLKRIEGASDG